MSRRAGLAERPCPFSLCRFFPRHSFIQKDEVGGTVRPCSSCAPRKEVLVPLCPVGGRLPPRVPSVCSCVLRVVSVLPLMAWVVERPLSAASPKAGAGVFPTRNEIPPFKVL